MMPIDIPTLPVSLSSCQPYIIFALSLGKITIPPLNAMGLDLRGDASTNRMSLS